MRIGRTLPPAAAPIYAGDLIYGLKGLLRPQSALERFETDIKKKYGVPHCWLLSSGRAALCVILEALHHLQPKRDTIVIPAFVCYSVPAAVVKAGLSIRLCDLDPDTMAYDYDQLDAMLKQDADGPERGKILAIVQVHFFGLTPDTGRLKAVLRNFPEIAVVEDAAQAFGAVYKDKAPGTGGDVGFFSLGRGKVISTVEGGIILTDREDIADTIGNIISDMTRYRAGEIVQLILYACFLALFQHPLFFWLPKSLPFLKIGYTIYDPDFESKKMSGFQAGLARNWQTKTRKFQTRRAANAKHYKAKLSFLTVSGYDKAVDHSGNVIRYPIRLEDAATADRLLNAGEKQGLGIAKTYPDSINNISQLNSLFNEERYPHAKDLTEKVVTLPVHPYLARRDIEKILGVLSRCIGSTALQETSSSRS